MFTNWVVVNKINLYNGFTISIEIRGIMNINLNLDWVAVSVILSVIAMIAGLAYFVYYALKHIKEDHSED